MDVYRYNGKWYKVSCKQYEPERQTVQIAWSQIREAMTKEESYRRFFEKQREDARILYPSFRKDVD